MAKEPTRILNSPVLIEQVEQKIYLIRGHKVMLAHDLAELYGVATFNLNKAVKRNRDRFPEDFCFQLSREEYQGLRFQFGILKGGRGQHRKYLPYAFTEQGVAMLSSVLHSKRAVLVNIAIIRAFVKLREMLAAHKELAVKLAELERKLEGHDQQIHALFEAIRQLMEPPSSAQKKPIGFLVSGDH